MEGGDVAPGKIYFYLKLNIGTGVGMEAWGEGGGIMK